MPVALKLGKSEQYTHSGAVPLLPLLAVPLAVFVGAYPLAYLLTKLSGWLGSVTIYGVFLVVLLYGVFAGAACGWLASLMKLRNLKVGFVLGLVSGLIVLYCNWNAHLKELIGPSPLLLPIEAISEIGGYLYHEGSWRLGRSSENMTGIPLAILWGLEALVILLLAGFIPYGMLDTPFCELAKVWLEKKETFEAFEWVGPGELYDALKAGDLSVLTQLQAPSNPRATMRVTLQSHPDATTFFTLSLHNVVRVVGKDGKEQEKVETIAEPLVLPYPQLEPLRAFLSGRVAKGLPA